MMAQKFISLIVILFACLFATIKSTPVKDVSSTTIDIVANISSSSTTASGENFIVSVKRVDDLIDDGGGLLAERVSSVLINFNLKEREDDKKIQLLVNDKPIELGISSIQVVEAQIIPNDIKLEQVSEYLDNFDIGLVTVKVNSLVEQLEPINKDLPPGVTVYRITLAITVIEIDGTYVKQTDAIERIIEIKQQTREVGKSHSRIGYYLHQWWCNSSTLKRILFTSFVLTCLFGIFFMAIPTFIHSLIGFFVNKNSINPAISHGSGNGKDEKIIFVAEEEQTALLGEEKQHHGDDKE